MHRTPAGYAFYLFAFFYIFLHAGNARKVIKLLETSNWEYKRSKFRDRALNQNKHTPLRETYKNMFINKPAYFQKIYRMNTLSWIYLKKIKNYP